MTYYLTRWTLVLVLAGIAAYACSSGDIPGRSTKNSKVEYQVLAEIVSPEDSLSHLRFIDGDQLSLNNRCPVRKVPLNPKMSPAYVNGRPVGFC